MKIDTDVIINTICNADEKKKTFYRSCFERDYAFDVVCGAKKFEIRPMRLSGYWYGATVHAPGYDIAEISYEDLKNSFQ